MIRNPKMLVFPTTPILAALSVILLTLACASHESPTTGRPRPTGTQHPLKSHGATGARLGRLTSSKRGVEGVASKVVSGTVSESVFGGLRALSGSPSVASEPPVGLPLCGSQNLR